MDLKPLPFRATLEEYLKQAEELLEGHRTGDAQAIRMLHENHPGFLDSQITWLPKNLPDSEIRSAALELADAQLALARWYSFRSWTAVAEYAAAVTRNDSPVFQFESAVEAVVTGDAATLESWLRENPDLVHARSSRITHFNPPMHRATLLHYIAANGVEGYRQKTPGNAVEIARTLLRAGAAVDALADMYGGHYTTMSMLVSSGHPAKAGVQVALVETLVDFGASVEACGSDKWGSPLMTALAFGYSGAAEALVGRGARIDSIASAAGLGRLDDAARLLGAAEAEGRHRALALAAQHGHADIVRLLLDAGEDPNRYNPDGNHSHSTPLHQAVWAGHAAVVELLVERGARLDIKDTTYRGTPLGWALYGGQTGIAEFLRAKGAKAGES
jgi:ankyrin repeat protein